MVADARANNGRKAPQRHIVRDCLAGDAGGEEDCESVLTDSTMGNSSTSCKVIFSFRRIEKIICSWRDSGTRNAAVYSLPPLLRGAGPCGWRISLCSTRHLSCRPSARRRQLQRSAAN
jgi:hypothetical protein